jgi:hypothetical protein
VLLHFYLLFPVLTNSLYKRGQVPGAFQRHTQDFQARHAVAHVAALEQEMLDSDSDDSVPPPDFPPASTSAPPPHIPVAVARTPQVHVGTKMMRHYSCTSADVNNANLYYLQSCRHDGSPQTGGNPYCHVSLLRVFLRLQGKIRVNSCWPPFRGTHKISQDPGETAWRLEKGESSSVN